MLSYKENIPRILEVVEKTGAKKILDIGCAFGKYGLLIREQYLSKKAETEISPTDDIIIDAVEYTKYFNERPELKYIYNEVFAEDMFNINDFSKYDLVLLIDVAEHYEKDRIKNLIRKINVPVLVSTPKQTVMYTKHYYGDPNHHISQWSSEDFNGRDFSTGLSFIYLENENRINN